MFTFVCYNLCSVLVRKGVPSVIVSKPVYAN